MKIGEVGCRTSRDKAALVAFNRGCSLVLSDPANFPHLRQRLSLPASYSKDTITTTTAVHISYFYNGEIYSTINHSYVLNASLAAFLQ